MIEPVRDSSVLEGYLSDASNVRGHAEALLRPSTTEEVAEVLRHCQAHNMGARLVRERKGGKRVRKGGKRVRYQHFTFFEKVEL